MSDPTPPLGAAIRYHRKSKGRSPEQVAAAARLSPRTYRRIENDERRADARELDAVCEALGIGVEALLDTTTDSTEIRLRIEYGARLFAVRDAVDPNGKALVLNAEDLPSARTQVLDDRSFWACAGWLRDDATLEVTAATRGQVDLWVRDAAHALRPGGLSHDPDDTMAESLARIRHHVVPATVT